jgi:hypothetical protein
VAGSYEHGNKSSGSIKCREYKKVLLAIFFHFHWDAALQTEYKKGYQPRTNLVKDENGDLFVDYHSLPAIEFTCG